MTGVEAGSRYRVRASNNSEDRHGQAESPRIRLPYLRNVQRLLPFPSRRYEPWLGRAVVVCAGRWTLGLNGANLKRAKPCQASRKALAVKAN